MDNPTPIAHRLIVTTLCALAGATATIALGRVSSPSTGAGQTHRRATRATYGVISRHPRS